MGSYYYLVAQLPCLIYEQKPPMSSKNFRDLVESHMKKKDIALFDSLSLDADITEKTGCGFVDKYREWESTLRVNLALQRAIKFKRDIPIGDQKYSMDATAAAAKAIDEPSPLDAEFLLDKARWQAIDDLTGNDIFNRNYLYAYYLKLLLIERREVFNAERGFSEYKSLYASILDRNNGESAQESVGDHT